MSFEWKRIGVMDGGSGDDEISLDDWNERSEKTNDQDEVCGMSQEDYSIPEARRFKTK